jgi:hypothetical protein
LLPDGTIVGRDDAYMRSLFDWTIGVSAESLQRADAADKDNEAMLAARRSRPAKSKKAAPQPEHYQEYV